MKQKNVSIAHKTCFWIILVMNANIAPMKNTITKYLEDARDAKLRKVNSWTRQLWNASFVQMGSSILSRIRLVSNVQINSIMTGKSENV